MKIHLAVISTCTLVGLTASVAQAQSMPDYYVGAGVRAGLNDSTALVIDSKGKITDWGDVTLSTRPALLVGNEFEIRLPITLEVPVTERVYPYAGVGIAYNTDGLDTVDPMVTAGVDLGVGPNLILDLNLNVIFQSTNSDTDAEIAATLNYAF